MRERNEMIALADRLLRSARTHASHDHALVTIPGPVGGRGRRVDGLEGFARTFMLAAFRIAGTDDEESDRLAQWYARGLAAGADPEGPNAWVRPKEASQARVEAASIALGLDMTRPKIWDRLDPTAQTNIKDYLAEVTGDDDFPANNWLWFQIVTETFLRSVSGSWSLEDIKRDLALYRDLQRDDGWFTDGDGRKFDHYAGWAMHLYPLLWQKMEGGAELARQIDPDFTEQSRRRLDRYLQDAIQLVGADGSPLIQGRSLIYRFAAAAPFWAGAMAEVPSLPPGQLRNAAISIVRHFVDRGAPSDDDLLTLGWFGTWPKMAQSYSGPSSPYWASKGLLGIALPADHPVWTAPLEPLPSQGADFQSAMQSPGWIASGTQDDGIVRIANHGTDNDAPGSRSADSPLYARFGYSTATWPLIRDIDWRFPSDQSVTLLDEDAKASHRTGMFFLGSPSDDTASSLNHLHWVKPDANQHGYGGGHTGSTTGAGTVIVRSMLRGPFEVRIITPLSLSDRAQSLRMSGWAVSTGPSGQANSNVNQTSAVATTESGLTSSLSLRADLGLLGVDTVSGATPCGGPSAYPFVEVVPTEGKEYILVINLNGLGEDQSGDLDVSAEHHLDGGLHVKIDWPDGKQTEKVFFDLGSAAPLARNAALQVVRDLERKLGSRYPADTTADLRYPLRKTLEGESTGANVGWTSGFWVGTLALASLLAQDPTFLATMDDHAESFLTRIEERIDVDHHDMGFLYTLACTFPYRLTGDERLRTAALKAAATLAERYLPNAEIIQAWGDLDDPTQRGRAIIDSLMNLPLLYWAYAETGNSMYEERARRHAEQLLKTIIRDDGSTYHTYHFDPDTGAPLRGSTAQGATDDSMWARGQAWGIYGFSLSALLAQDSRFLEAAATCADRFLAQLPEDGVPFWDMVFTDGDDEPRDSSSAAIAVCGLLELSEQLDRNGEGRRASGYRAAAIDIMTTLMTKYRTAPGQADALLAHSVYSKPDNKGVDEGSLWGDYFYLEAMSRLMLPEWKNPWLP